MARVLIVHHTPSPSCQAMLEQVLAGAGTDELEGVEVDTRAALTATASDVLAADAVVLGSPANIGYISGALKHFFDQVYYPVLEEARGLPFGCYLHGNSDTAGAERAVETITTGLGWVAVADTVTVLGEPATADLEACWELGATVAARLVAEL